MSRPYRRIMSHWLALVSAVLPLGGCANRPSSMLPVPPSVEVPYSRIAPLMTADTGDPAWQHAAALELVPPLPGDVPAVIGRTTVRLLHRNNTLFVRFECEDDHVESPYRTRDDPLHRADVVEVFIDFVGDCQEYFEVQVSPHGIVFDQRIRLSAPPTSDAAGVLTDEFRRAHFTAESAFNFEEMKIATLIHSEADRPYWRADIAIPLPVDSIDRGRTIRANFIRYDYGSGVAPRLNVHNWSATSAGRPHVSPIRAGYLRLIREP